MGHDGYDPQQQQMRTQSQGSNSQYALNNKASIASASSASNQGPQLQSYGQLPAQRPQPQSMAQQQSIANASPGAFSSAAHQQQQELQKKR